MQGKNSARKAANSLRKITMKLLLATFLAFIVGTFTASAQTSSINGFWEGAVEKDGKTWRVNLNIVNDKAFVDFIDVDAHGLEFSVARNGDSWRIERPQPNGKPIIFEGKLANEIFSGAWSGTNTNAVFRLKRGKAPAKFFREEEITFTNGDVTLSASLILPLTKSKFPVVVFTHGSGAETRAPSRSLALRFARRGIAALVYDKRGTGKSSGNWRAASMEDLARDAIAGIEFLKTRAEIDPRKIGVSGHSQGGWIAPLTSVMSKSVAFVITSAASGVSPDRQSIYHRAGVMREMGFSENDIKIATELREKLYASGRLLLENKQNAAEERRKVSVELEKYAKEPWFERGAELPPNLDNDNPSRGALELLFFEPVPMWRKVKVPVLLLWGDKDAVVPVAEGRTIIENALKKAGNKDFTTKIFPNVNHGVVIVNQSKTWDFPRVDLSYYDAMVDWTLQTLKKLK